MDGLKSFNQAAQELIFGHASPARQQGRVVTIQTLGGSGALKVGADFFKDNGRSSRSARVTFCNS